MYFELHKFTQEITVCNNVHLILLDSINSALQRTNLQANPACWRVEYVTSRSRQTEPQSHS